MSQKKPAAPQPTPQDNPVDDTPVRVTVAVDIVNNDTKIPAGTETTIPRYTIAWLRDQDIEVSEIADVTP